MSTEPVRKVIKQRRYPSELRERAVPLVRERIAENGERFGAVTVVARQLGIDTESLRNWITKQRSTAGRSPASLLRSGSAWASWRKRTESCGAPTRSCGARRLSSRPSSTAGRRSDALHRRQ